MTQSPYSHYSPYHLKLASSLDSNDVISTATGGLAGGLGGAGIGALIQALRGKSKLKGALIGGGIGGVAGAGLGLIDALIMKDKNDRASNMYYYM